MPDPDDDFAYLDDEDDDFDDEDGCSHFGWLLPQNPKVGPFLVAMAARPGHALSFTDEELWALPFPGVRVDKRRKIHPMAEVVELLLFAGWLKRNLTLPRGGYTWRNPPGQILADVLTRSTEYWRPLYRQLDPDERECAGLRGWPNIGGPFILTDDDFL